MFILTWQTFQPLFTDQQGVLGEKPQWQQSLCNCDVVYFGLATVLTTVYRSARSTCGEASVTAKSLFNCNVVYFGLATILLLLTTVYRSGRHTLEQKTQGQQQQKPPKVFDLFLFTEQAFRSLCAGQQGVSGEKPQRVQKESSGTCSGIAVYRSGRRSL